MGVPYVPVLGLVDSDLLRNREDMKVCPDPFEPDRHSVVAKAYRPDVALLHGLRADRAGNVDLGRPCDDVLLAEASRRVVVTVEEVVERLEPPEQGRYLPGLLVDAVVEAPFGAHPAGCPGRYPVDTHELTRYIEAAQSDEGFAAYLAETVHAPASHEEYAERFVPAEWRRGGTDNEAPHLSRSA